ncbi:G-D-S-L family lipolytic protein [Paracidovorax avenae]|uniref:SGNH/GDSL hydrolase family protein n=1 Tax=Paracidovorax avenae TaxID=80867 RepID=UPI000D1782B5|nr:SGNH/GDSL hydrolase family protein [Paracidovorax avenae]AVS70939.1 G-D-S-L family lipolytic protein [Paracidovorax avenae]
MATAQLSSSSLPIRRRTLLGALCAGAILQGCGGGGGGGSSLPVLQSAWSAPVSDYNAVSVLGSPAPAFVQDRTIRQVMRLAAGGDGVRVRISNLFGPGTLAVGSLRIARSAGGTRIAPGTDVALTFGGQASVAIPAGQELWSDVVAMPLDSLSDVAVSLYVGPRTPLGTYHQLGMRNTYMATGNVASAEDVAPADAPTTSYYWVSGIDVRNTSAQGTIVTFGDSITDGLASTLDGSRRYPDALARRLAADPSLRGLSVANAGISGNRILHDGAGPRALGRFDRDVLQLSGATHVIVLIGINDIGFSNIVPSEAVTADEIIAGLSTLVQRGRAAQLKVILGTLLPFDHALGPDGQPSPYYDQAGDAKRARVNDWIRSGASQADGVIDFDAAVRDPAAPSRMRAAYDSGDHLHPGDAGYQAMADAIDLSLFR